MIWDQLSSADSKSKQAKLRNTGWNNHCNVAQERMRIKLRLGQGRNHLLLIVLLINPIKEGIETEGSMIYAQAEEILCQVAVIQQFNNLIANLVQILLSRLKTCLLLDC